MPYKGKRHPRSKVRDSEARRKMIAEDVKQFLEDGKTIKSEVHEMISPPRDLRFNPPEINTYEHREFLKRRDFIWVPEENSWFAPSEASWVYAYETCMKNQKAKSEGNWTNANTSEARTSRFIKRFK